MVLLPARGARLEGKYKYNIHMYRLGLLGKEKEKELALALGPSTKQKRIPNAKYVRYNSKDAIAGDLRRFCKYNAIYSHIVDDRVHYCM